MVMQMQGAAEEFAKQIVHNIIREHEEQYCRFRNEYLRRPSTSLFVKKWFQVLEFSMAGNALWSIHALQYHLDVRNPYICPAEISSVFKELQVMRSKLDNTKRSIEIYQYRPNLKLIKAGASATDPAYKVLEALDDTYITSMPSKGFRHHLIDALQTWFNVPERSLALISGVTSLLHEASLMWGP
ncbi:hypothetical protein CNMCM5793_006065 [Aspergillus hiratsukae]|uniref:Uncharacterized protein n=1 Tax=Aspergillus hiratsukae TaxID=1194566 RepID=A0A8H6P449_9EURO|nr:hypothetical protein CNMCM5793_006065 [Aspergillus hiratsukae]